MAKLSQKMRFATRDVPGCCSSRTICGFSEQHGHFHDRMYTDFLPSPGNRMYLAAFVNDKESRAMYEELCHSQTLLTQTPISHGVFICVFKVN